MLSSTANNLYWMARNVERAENMARVLDVSYRSALLSSTGDAASEWQAPLMISGAATDFAQRYGEASERNVIRFFALDLDNPSGILASLRTARESARALRATISTEMWESLNATWIEVRDLDLDGLTRWGYREFFDWVKDRSHLFRGVTFGTMLHNDAFHFARLGTYLERADNTARLLDTKYHILLPSVEDVGGAVDYYQWGAILRAVAAFRAYRQVYSDVITPWRVAELLMLRPDMPRSLRFSLDQVTPTLDILAGGRNFECQVIAGGLHTRLRYGRTERIFQAGLHEFLVDFIARTADLGDQIGRDFMMTI